MAQKLIIDFVGAFIDSHALYQALFAGQGAESFEMKAALSLSEMLAKSGQATRVHAQKKLMRLLKDTPLACKPFQPLVDTLKVLKQAGFQLGLLAPGLTKQAKQICEEYQLNFFDFIEGDMPFFSKDYLFGRVLKKYAINPNDVLYLSGSLKNLQFAEHYKVKAIANNWGLDSPEDLQKAKPIYTILTPGELLTVMTEELVA